jgi:GT2 family glycosyltransferase
VFQIAVIIPHFNDTRRLELCLQSLMLQVAKDVEVVVVDNDSTEDPAGICAMFPDLTLCREPRRGAAHARNHGVAVTTAPLLVFLDCDCLAAPGWLGAARNALLGTDIVGGRVDVFDERPGPRNGAQAFEAVFAFDNCTYVKRKGFSVTANLGTKRHVFERTGPFVDGVAEDLEWCRRAVRSGFQLSYDDALRVSHPSRGNWQELRKKWLRLTREAFKENRPTPWWRLYWAARALLMPVSVLVHIPRVLRHPALRNGRERLLAIAVLIRLRLARMGWMLGQATGLCH